MHTLTFEQLNSLVAPYGKKAIIEKTVVEFNKYAEAAEINTPLRMAHFLAQLAHESDHFKTTKEYSGSKKRYAPWYGRGLIQVTWEENYQDFYKWAKEHDLNPPNFLDAKGREEVAVFPWAFLGAVWYWEKHNLNALADEDNVKKITKVINGGYNGLDDRIRFLNKAKAIFDIEPSSGAGDDEDVEKIQRRLVELGYKISIDGDLGPKTRAAIKMFQAAVGLKADGIAGPRTQKALFS